MADSEVAMLTNQALDAFWESIVQERSQIKSGDLSPERSIALREAAEAAIAEWLANNTAAPPDGVTVSYRFRLVRDVERFPDFTAKAGASGRITRIDESGIWGQMDQHIAGCEEWNNEIHWSDPDEFAADTAPI